jgi:hypothetical protein
LAEDSKAPIMAVQSIIMKNGKDPPIKIREITGWYRIEIKKI